MPAVIAPAKVLVTGANGYIAVWVVRTLLEKGYSVRGSVRSLGKGAHLKKIFEQYGDKFELVVVEDISTDGAFDDAVKGIDAIEHTASPATLGAADPQELIGPAVNGTLGILNSALKYGANIKRIVITSSTSAIVDAGAGPKTFTEKDWNERSTQLVESLGVKASKYDWYNASKTLAEKAAWSFVDKNKESIGWDLVVLNPCWVFGPVIHEVTTSATSLNVSSLQWYSTVLQETSAETLQSSGGWIDVRDLGLAHVLSLEKENAGGERLLVSAGPYVWQDWLDSANSLQPSPIPSHPLLPKGTPGGGKGATYSMQYDTTKSSGILGIKYLSMEDTTRDILKDFEARGW